MTKYRNVILYPFIIMMAIIQTSCGNHLGNMEVHLGGEVIDEGDKIVINGETNLLPESRVTGKVIVNEDEVLLEATELVDKKGRFKMELDHHQYGDAEVIVTFDFLNQLQEEHIIEHYGEGGENLEGPFVYIDEHWEADQINKKAEASVILEADSEQNTYELTAPEWKERPEDYGDPRVWIELDEITEDGEYFYVSGQSNLLEGSVISGYYSDRSLSDDETQVNPDGTFDLKIEYNYSEDAYFTIIFDPFRQWVSIREHYGENGEKLIGKLVEQNSDSLRIVATFDYEHQ